MVKLELEKIAPFNYQIYVIKKDKKTELFSSFSRHSDSEALDHARALLSSCSEWHSLDHKLNIVRK